MGKYCDGCFHITHNEDVEKEKKGFSPMNNERRIKSSHKNSFMTSLSGRRETDKRNLTRTTVVTHIYGKIQAFSSDTIR